MEMDLINLISVLLFLTRRQLLKFMQANRYTYKVITEYFGKKPSIYAHISLKKDYVDPFGTSSSDSIQNMHPEFLVHLTALNCDCEQQLSINNLYTYKSVTVPECEECPQPPISDSAISSTIWEHYELNYHKNCPGWTKVNDPQSEIHRFRRDSSILASLLEEQRDHREFSECDSISIWMHPMHSDDTFGIKWICDEYKFAHRKQTYQEWRPCAGLELRFTDFSHIIRHLEADFIEIYKLDFGPYMEPIEWEAKEKEFTKQEFEQYYKILSWLVENQKITTNTVVNIDLNFISILFSRLQIEMSYQQFLLNSIAKCGQLRIANFVNELSGDKRNDFFTIYPEANLFPMVNICKQNEFLKNPLLVEFIARLMPEDVLQLLKCYTDFTASIEKPYRLFVHLHINNNICAYLLENFIKSQSPYSYFALITGIFKKGEHSTIYYNQITKECLRIVPAIMHSTSDIEHMPFYMARYDIHNSKAEFLYKSFFDRLELNAIRCDEKWHLYNEDANTKTTTDCEKQPPEFIYSFSSFYAIFFPDDFGQNGELFNGYSKCAINESILPP